MNTCKSLVVLLKLSYITLLPVLEAQEIKVSPEVTGYLGHNVTLPCQFIPGAKGYVTQVQWDVKLPDGEEFTIIVANEQHGFKAHESFLKLRVGIAGQSLVIRDVEFKDAGSYTCSITTFPSGPFVGSTNLVVREPMPLSSAVVSAIVIAGVLLLVITAAVVYLVFIRRRRPTVRHRVYTDTGGPVMDAARPSVIFRDEDVVYSDIKLKPSRDAKLASQHTADDVMYSEVVHRQQPSLDELYARVVKV